MIRILFVCHGNICRSPMAESVFTHLVRERGMEQEIVCASAAAHTDEIGNPPHYGTREKLRKEHIPLVPHRARLMTREDGKLYDLLIGMDEYNVRDIKRIVGTENARKVHLLLEYAGSGRAIADPWYTGDFDETFSDVLEGCRALLDAICTHTIRKSES